MACVDTGDLVGLRTSAMMKRAVDTEVFRVQRDQSWNASVLKAAERPALLTSVVH